MGRYFRYFCQVEARRLTWLIATIFAMAVLVQYLELPYGNFMSSLFNIRNNQIDVISSTRTEIASSPYQMVTNMTQLNGSNITVIAQGPIGFDQEGDPEDESPSKDFVESVKNYTVGDLNYSQYVVAPELSITAPMERHGGSDATDGTSPSPAAAPTSLPLNLSSPTSLYTSSPPHTVGDLNYSQYVVAPELSIPAPMERRGGSDATDGTSPSPAAAPTSLPLNLSSPTSLYTSSPPHTNGTSPSPAATPTRVPLNLSSPTSLYTSSPPKSHDSSLPAAPANKKRHDKQIPVVVSISEMNKLFLKSRDSYHAMKPLWASPADQELLDAKSQIVNGTTVKDPNLYAPIYRNVSMFKRSYELMERTLKVYVYKEGNRPIFHGAPLEGIYASEGWFMKLLEANKHYVTKTANEAHLFYLPYSSRVLRNTLYVPNSHSRKNLIQFLKKYMEMIVVKYPFWNRTGGADHFLVACHDWGPAETKQYLGTCIRALCNDDIKEGFKFGKDVPLPETYVRSPQNLLRDVGGKPPSKRPILAFFAGSMHGYLRPILLQQWQNKDPHIKIFAKMPKVKGNMNYIKHMKSSKYCICAKGYEVNSPRVVEAIFYECVPVIISDNFVPPFFETLNWESFAVFILEKDIPDLKKILLSISKKRYFEMQRTVKKVQQHFLWHAKPEKYDMFHMILHSIWHNRVFSTNPG